MKLIKKALECCLIILTEHIPVAAFFIMFTAFIIQIIWRYVINNPQPWTYDLTVLTYMVMIVLGSACTMRYNQHVRFTVLLDSFPRPVQLVLQAVGNMFVAVLLLICIVPSFQYNYKVTMPLTSGVLHWPLFWFYFPYLILIAVSAVIFLRDAYLCGKELFAMIRRKDKDSWNF